MIREKQDGFRKMSDEDRGGICGFIWIITLILGAIAFRDWGFPMWSGVILSLAISIAISMIIYYKWTKNK